MTVVGPSDLAFVLSLMLTFAAWAYLLARGGRLQTLILWALLATLLPVIGPIIVFLFYRQRDERKQK